MAKTKTGKTTKGSRKANPKYLGVKLYGGQKAKEGSIIVRQRGTKFKAGKGVKIGKDHTLFSVTSGIVEFTKKFKRIYVNVSPNN